MGKNQTSFKKGDPRINRKGRPKSFDAYRELARQIAHEVAKDKEKNPLLREGHKVTIAEAILVKWASSGNFQMQKMFMEVAFGKVPDDVNLDIKGNVGVEIKVGMDVNKL